VLEVAEAAVDQPGGAAARAEREVAGFEESGPEPTSRGVAGQVERDLPDQDAGSGGH